jgi:hypothetical protein
MTVTQVSRFAYRQGPGRTLLSPPVEVDDTLPTTAMLPPRAARGVTGQLLPSGTRDLLDAAPYPGWPACRPVDPLRLGHLLLAAFGLQRREPSNAFNDHRAIASVRGKYPVHAFVLPDRSTPSYLDPYRHALVDLDLPAGVDWPLPAAGDTAVLLSGRYTDLPTGYARLRCALVDLEIGVNLRSLFAAADLFGVPATLQSDGTDARAAEAFVRATGPGAWSPPVRVTLGGLTAPAGAQRLPGRGPADGRDLARLDDLLLAESAHWSIAEAAEIAGHVYDLADEAVPDAHGLPATGRAGGATSWARAIWNRTAGRAPTGVHGFMATPGRVGADCLADLVDFAAVPAPSALLREVAKRVRISVALQRADELPTGLYRLVDGALATERTDPQVMAAIQSVFGYPLSPFAACGISHATAVFVLSVDVEALLDDLGAGAWPLLQRWCGWVAHGVCLAAAGHGLFARPARSFDEHILRTILALPGREVPVFMTACGRGRFTEPALDLRI